MLTKEEFVKTHPDVRVGMTAYSIDGDKLGVIKRIDEDSLTIERGWFFHKDYTIPYDDIEDIRGDRVIVRPRHADLEEERMEGERPEEAEFTGRTGGMAEEYDRGHETEEAGIPVREEEFQAEKRTKESEVRAEAEHLEIPVQKEDVIVEQAPAEESWTSETGEKAFEEEEMGIPRKETRTENEPASDEVRKEEAKVEPNKPAQKK